MNTFLKILIGGTLILAPVMVTAEERTIVQGPKYIVEHDAASACGRNMAITIRSDDYAFFAEHSERMQITLDATRAMLEFHCNRIDKIEILGELRGLDDPVYSGTAMRDDGWLIVADRSIKKVRDVVDDRWSSFPKPEGEIPDYTVANLRAGMSVDEVSTSVYETFGSWPEYDPERKVMTLKLNGCPDDFETRGGYEKPGPNWKCLRVWFGDQGAPTLKGLQLVQVIDENDLDVVEAALRGRFGQPIKRTVSKRQNEWRGNGKTRQLSWGDPADDNAGDYPLVANLFRSGNRSITNLRLNESRRKGNWDTQGSSLAGLVL